MIEVLCCCDPSNLKGHAPEGLDFPLREWVDEDGNTGFAYPSHDVDWESVPGFVPAILNPHKPKTWKDKKTWKKS